ncbi:MAG: tetratricopeptide repeat protein [Hyphomicrobium sp.]|uniref:tetratricopeptide repeat protein n=1 Tax=Hyphomicrobium sp. TaxID=82 RepID=UPI001324ED9E|nr:tetratricopeptide repeat protein [Hyphomicrobium sp.]KAB2943666.1 MAG: tetratricopeptide repeat protein [Hyphomicrobium sp.]MBZ0210634.1 tetratricopeptide repeat protein [Hyphomicrobium sp.]
MLRPALLAMALIPLPSVGALAAPADAGLKAQDAATALVRGDAGQAVTGYTEALKDPALPNDRRATILNDRAVAYARLGQTKLAIDDFNRAAQLFPEYAAIYNNRGNLLLALGYPDEAIKDFNRAIVLAPGYAAALSNRAGAYAKVGHNDQAIRDYTSAVRLMPQSAAPLAGRGRVHLAAGRPHAAIRDFSRAVTADPRFATAYRSRAEAKLDIMRVQDAIEDLSRAIAFDASNPELYLLRGQAYLASDNVAAALKDFTYVTTLDPRSARGFAARGLANGIAQVWEEAFADLNRAIELDPRSGTGFAYRAVVYKMSGQTDVGVKDAETAEKLDPDGPEVLWAKGEIEEAQGRVDQAIADYKKAVALQPRLKLAADGLQRLAGDAANAEDREIAGAGIEGWRVVQQGSHYYAVSDQFRRLRIPLEMAGEGQPRLLEWQVKEPPLRGIATLRFAGGVIPGAMGPEEIEQIAILDLDNNSVVGIEPHREGKKVATWTWQDDRVVVASVDGATDEFILRAGRGGADPRRYTSTEQGGWSPWGQLDSSYQEERRPRRRKPKTIFQLLFN